MYKFIPFAFMFAACTYSVSMQHSVGSTDTVDENQSASPTVSPELTIPLSGPTTYQPRQPAGQNGPDRQYEDWS
jgi:hypothetical protein